MIRTARRSRCSGAAVRNTSYRHVYELAVSGRQSPQIIDDQSGLLAAFIGRYWRNRPLFGVNKSIRPLPNWPMRTSPAKLPHVEGAIAIPHGESRNLPCWRRLEGVCRTCHVDIDVVPFPAAGTSSCFAASCFA